MQRTSRCNRGHRVSKTERQCKKCQKLWRQKNKRKVAAYGKRYHNKNKKRRKAKHKEQHLLSNYGLTTKQYQAIMKHQWNVCAVCKKSCPTGRSLAVDHDHETSKVRGLLCFTCNTKLHILENDRLFDALQRYLKNPPAFAILNTK